MPKLVFTARATEVTTLCNHSACNQENLCGSATRPLFVVFFWMGPGNEAIARLDLEHAAEVWWPMKVASKRLEVIQETCCS